MKIIGGGAGRVGYGIAASLAAEGNDITVIDQDESLIRELSSSLDVRAVVGHAADPDILKKSGAENADMIVAATRYDEINMISCKVAHAVFSVPTKIARIRRQNYLKPAWRSLFSHENLPIDLTISPEREIGEAVLAWLDHPGAYENIPFAEGAYNVLGLVCDQDCPVLDTPLRDLAERFNDLRSVVVALMRAGTLFTPNGESVIKAGDTVYVVAVPDQVRRTLGLFGLEDQVRGRVIIAGGGAVGSYVAESLEDRAKRKVRIRLIERSRERAELIAERYTQAIVIHGNAVERSLLREAEIADASAVLALTEDDNVNILVSMTARDMGCHSTLAILNKANNHRLMRTFKLGTFLNPRSVTISRILRYIRRGRIKDVHPIENGLGEVIEAEALETSPLIGSKLRTLNLEEGIRLGGVMRNGKAIVPRGDTVIQPHDRIVLFALGGRVRRAENLFRVGIDYLS